MINKLILDNDERGLEFKLYSYELIDFEQYSDEVVYQNEVYKIILVFNNLILNIKNIDIIINNESIVERFKIEYKIDKERVILQPNLIFSTIFGFAIIGVEISYTDDRTEYYYTEHISVAVEYNKETVESIENMIDYIYAKNSELLQKSNLDRISKISSDIKKDGFSDSDTELKILNNIVQLYSNNLKFFMSDSKYTIISSNKIENFEKIKTISSETMKFIVSNPEQLIPVNYETGIKYEKIDLQPLKTLVSSNKYNYDIYENRVIIGFLKYLIVQLTDKIKALENILDMNSIGVFKNESIKDKCILSSNIIYKYSRVTMIKYLKEISNINKVLNDLFLKYKKIIKCKEHIIDNIPKPTKVFLSVNHYRSIFESIKMWFQYGNYNMEDNRIILSFLTADELFEHYCLLNIIESLKSIGFYEDKYKRECYEYSVASNLYRQSKMDNTFYFSNGNNSLVVYYQPVIYSYKSDTRNGLSLFRIDKKKNYFIPDFVIKIYLPDDSIRYLVFDSKWSRQGTIINSYFEKTVYKYSYLIRDENDIKKNNFVWILQGKNDNTKGIYFNNNSEISRELNGSVFYESGIVKITPECSDEKLVNILYKIINGIS